MTAVLETALLDPPQASRIPLWSGLEEIPAAWGPCVVCIGVFDGVHRGHARLLDRAVVRAHRLGLPSVMLTFDPHPARVVGLARDTSTLSTLPARADLAAARGIDAVAVLPFTEQLAATSPEDFARDVLVVGLHAAAVVVGANFTFGARAAGTADTLRVLGSRLGFDTDPVELLHAGDRRCSSTHIRDCLRRGDISAATDALGHPHRVDGVLRGNQLLVEEHTALPCSGSYPVRLTHAGSPVAHAAVADVTPDQRLVLACHPASSDGPATVTFEPS